VQTSDAVTTIDLTRYAEAIAPAWSEKTPCIFATCDAEGRPDISIKGSAMVFDKDHLAFWERSHGATIENLRRNPHVAMLYRSPARGIGMWRFFGVAEVHPTGPLREQVRERTIEVELNKDPENKGIAVVIRVDRVTESGNLAQQR
jgi:hypothetical protein